MPRPKKAPPTPRRPTAAPWWAPILLLFAAALLYSTSVSGPLIFDDFGSIGRNQSIRSLTDVASIASPPVSTPIAGRPFANFTLALNYALHGLDVTGYHVANIALHAICGVLIFGLLRRQLRPAIGFSIALLWLVHPLNSEAVNYLAQRTEVLMAACYLFTLYASVRAHDAAAPWRWQLAAVIVCAAGMASKETMVSAPLAIVLYDRIFVFTSWGDTLRARGRFYAALALTWLLLAAVVLINGQTTTAGFANAQTSPALYFLNQMPMIVRYLKLAIWPHPLVLYYGWPVPLTAGDVWLPMLVVVALTALVFWTLWRQPKLGYLGLWILLTLGPTSSVLPIGTEVGAERRMYLPLIALVTLAVLGVVAVARRLQPGGIDVRAGLAATAALALLFGGVTMARTRDYASALTMAQLDVERWPTAQTHQVYGVELAGAGRNREAIEQLQLAEPGYAAAGYFLGAELIKAGRTEEGIAALQRFVAAEPDLPVVPSARMAIARALEARGRAGEAIEQLRRAIAAAPARAEAHGQLANLLAATQRFGEAIPHYRAFLDAQPQNADAWTGLAIAQLNTGKTGEALTSFKAAVDANPRQPQFRFNYARVLSDLGNVAEAKAQLQAALAIDPALQVARDLLKKLTR